MIFNNEKELKKFVLSKCKSSLAKSQERVYEIVDRFLQDFYRDYEPNSYVRTEQLLHSLVKYKIEPTGNGYETYVYFDYNSLKYYDGNKPSGKQVMDAAAKGLHGAIAIGRKFQYIEGSVSVWNDPKQILDAHAIEILKDMLVSEGIPITK